MTAPSPPPRPRWPNDGPTDARARAYNKRYTRSAEIGNDAVSVWLKVASLMPTNNLLYTKRLVQRNSSQQPSGGRVFTPATLIHCARATQDIKSRTGKQQALTARRVVLRSTYSRLGTKRPADPNTCSQNGLFESKAQLKHSLKKKVQINGKDRISMYKANDICHGACHVKKYTMTNACASDNVIAVSGRVLNFSLNERMQNTMQRHAKARARR